MRVASPISTWTQVDIASKLARVVKSVQYISGTYTSGATTKTVTITSVDTARTVILTAGEAPGGDVLSSLSWWTLNSATQAQANRAQGTDGFGGGGSNVAGTAYAVVVEFY